LLNAAVKLDLFTLLRQPAKVAEIAAALALGPNALDVLLSGCEALGLVERHGGFYRAADVAALALSRNSPFDQRALVRFADQLTYPAAVRLTESLREDRNAGLDMLPGEGATLYERLRSRPELARTFTEMMETVTRQVADRFVDAVDFADGGSLLDVGGGACTLAIALARRWERLQVRVLDLPWVVPQAQDRIAAAGLGGRIQVEGGDAFSTPLPPCDHLVFAHFLEIWSKARGRRLLVAARRALRPAGNIYLVNMMREDEGDGGFAVAAASAYFHAIASGEGMVRRWRDYERWLGEAGFMPLRRVTLRPLHGLITASVVPP
jgi:SAM-dependent methyltransferase